METRVTLPGRKIEQTAVEPGLEEFVEVQVVASREVDPSVRGTADEKFETIEDAREDDIVELEFENGVRRWVSVADLRDELKAIDPLLVTADRGVRIPSTLVREAETRGLKEIKDFAVKSLKLLRVDPADVLADQLARLGAKGIALYFENKLKPGPGLYRFIDPLAMGEQIVSEKELAGEAPILIFIHGTASKSVDSFGKLIANGERRLWDDLRSYYGDRILAFDHRTLSESPIVNAAALARLLPSGAKIHLVTHSRGGLIGELLCLPQIPKDQIKFLVEPFEKRAEDVENLTRLAELVARKKFKIEKYVRVAAPARGTILASKRLDIYLSILLNAIGLIPVLQASPTYHLVKATLLALAKTRTQPEELPGLEAMMPTSPLVSVLNDPKWKTGADLAVIAGDLKGAGIFGALKEFAVNAFFLEKNDLVVNTSAMYGGLHRESPVYFYDEGPEVIHFNYFLNDSSRRKLSNRLIESGKAGEEGFSPLSRGTVADLTIPPPSRGGTDRPVVFLLPGIMGSHLRDQKGRVWVSATALIRGGMRRLEIGDHDVRTDGLIGSSYQDLIDYLQSHFEVIPFAFDWRKSIADSAQALVERIRHEMESHHRPIRFLAHSMGGLVVRAMIARADSPWRRLCDERDCRLLMLGTPNRGSYAIPGLLLGRERLLRLLALADYKNDQGDLLEIISAYPGIAEMLPDEFFETAKWKNLKDARQPASTLLDKSKSLRQTLAEKGVDPDRMLYVAGAASSTPCEISVENGQVRIMATQLGDGRVTYDLGILPQVKTWYANVAHGDLADHRSSFPAYIDLLESGKTDKLRPDPPVSRGEEIIHELPIEMREVFPTEEDLVAAALGGSIKRPEPETAGYTLQISVVNGDLRFASHPVAVGHYHGDTIVSAEKVIDNRLNGELSKRYFMNLYPGQVGTSDVILNTRSNWPPGALIVGLGEVGEITQEKLREGVTSAALRYALIAAEQAQKEGATTWCSAAFSTLLLGTYGGNALSIEASLAAIIQGAIQANRSLQEQNLWDTVRIDRIELIELYEDIAVQSINAAHRVAEHPPIELRENESIEIVPAHLKSVRGARFHRPANQYRTGWWRRIQVTGEKKEESPLSANILKGLSQSRRLRSDRWFKEAMRDFISKWLEESQQSSEQREKIVSALTDYLNQDIISEEQGMDLRFLNLTDLARAEDTLQATQRTLIDQMIARQIDSASFDEKQAVALFELLIPNSIKDHMQVDADLVFVLDSESAQYPWELLAGRTRQGVQALALTKGMLRQFKTSVFRQNPQTARSRNVLVVGDTQSGYAELKGAQDEARIVAQLLKTDGYDVGEPLIKASAPAVIGELFARDYKILHLAGHGIYDQQNPERSGMILGNDMFLTTRELTNLRAVPELVFINCCYLGGIDQKLATESPNKLAASLAEELIRIGVRAVIAAGWAVNDLAATLFATEFYNAMLYHHGHEWASFGKAVLLARQKTHGVLSNSNTWGAYQCYGDPDFRLEIVAADGKPKSRQLTGYYSRRDYLDELKQIANNAEADTVMIDDIRDQLELIAQKIPTEWMDGATLAELANAWSAYNEPQTALSWYQKAVCDESATAPIQAIERLSHLETGLADRLIAEAGGLPEPSASRRKGKRNDPARLLENARSRLEWMISRKQDLGDSAERYSLLAGVYKRLAQLASRRDEQKRMMIKAADNYRRAYQIILERKGINDNYSAINWITYRFLLGQSADPAVKKEMLSLIGEVRRDAGKEAAKREPFWNSIGEADAMLIESLILGNLAKKQNELIGLYQKSFKFGPTPREKFIVLGHLAFLAHVLKPRAKARNQRGLLAEARALKAIRDAIEK